MHGFVGRFAWLGRRFGLMMLTVLLLAAGQAAAEDEFLPPEQAFRLSARMTDAGTAEVTFDIAPGYYMYRDRFAFKATGAQLGEPSYPQGKVYYDETFEKDMETYRKRAVIHIPAQANGSFTLDVTSQGCSDRGLCYPPMTSTVSLAAGSAQGVAATVAAVPGANGGEAGRIERALGSRELAVIVPMFLLLGLGLSFTPCVLPMLPILSSIIVGEGRELSRRRGLALSLSYSLGMALVYTLMGVAAGLAGQGLAAALQNAWVLGAFALLMAALSLSMFGVYQLQMPAAIQARLMGASQNRRAGSHLGVFAMGALSALIVGPCVAAPLAGALVYISQTRDAFIGGSALFAMAIGMSVPLILLGASAGALLPRAGAWMEGIKRFFGVLMLGTAWWIVSPVVPGQVQMAGWAVLGIGYAVSLVMQAPRRPARLVAGVLVAGLGLTQVAGLALGSSDPFAPLTRTEELAASDTHFRRIVSVEELDAVLASAQGKTVMLDFYADWCVSCKEMERFTFSDPRVKAHFDQMLLLQADVTANSAADQALLKRFGLFGPPGIVFFGSGGREIAGTRVIGYEDADKFLASLAAVRAGEDRTTLSNAAILE